MKKEKVTSIRSIKKIGCDILDWLDIDLKSGRIDLTMDKETGKLIDIVLYNCGDVNLTFINGSTNVIIKKLPLIKRRPGRPRKEGN